MTLHPQGKEDTSQPLLTSLPPNASQLFNASHTSIKAWLAQTEAAKAQPSTERGLKRKRSASPILDTQVSPVAKCGCLEPWEPAGGAMALSDKEHAYVTPPTSAVGIKTPIREETASQAPSTPTTTSKSSKLTIPKTPDWVGDTMTSHGLLHDNRKALNRYPAFKEKVLGVINQDRSSRMKDGSVQKVRDRQEFCDRANEDTFLQILLPLVVKGTYLGKNTKEGEALEDFNHRLADCKSDDDRERLKEAELGVEEFWDDGLRVTVNKEFQKTLLPNAYLDQGFEADIAKALAKVEGMKNPKPDRAYGLDKNKYPVPRGIIVSAETRVLLEIAPLMQDTFFFVEGKGIRGSGAEAENQARRGGATLVNAKRHLHALMQDVETKDSADERTFVFSATMSPQVMDIWVHWAEVTKQDGVIFHMNRLISKSLYDDGGIPQLRIALNNILEWGCNSRNSELQDFYNRLYMHEKTKLEDKMNESNAGRSSKRSRTIVDTSSSR